MFLPLEISELTWLCPTRLQILNSVTVELHFEYVIQCDSQHWNTVVKYFPTSKVHATKAWGFLIKCSLSVQYVYTCECTVRCSYYNTLTATHLCVLLWVDCRANANARHMNNTVCWQERCTVCSHTHSQHTSPTGKLEKTPEVEDSKLEPAGVVIRVGW